jgi:hypothetical protein
LFLLFVNDVIAVLTKNDCACQLYADDLKLYTTLNTDCDQDELQERLNDLHAWSNTWQLKISYKKCVAMLIDTAGHEPNIELKLGVNVIPLANDVKDLGVHIDNKLSFTVHINHIVAKAFARASLISKCFTSKDILTLMQAFNVYVRPLLEYASCVWSPYHTLKIAKIERVQRRFTKKLPGFADITYKERLRILNTDSLELRRLRNDLILAYNIIFNLTDLNSADYFTFANPRYDTRGHRLKLLVHHNRVDLRKNFFAERVVPIWNDLPFTDADLNSLRSFRNCIAKADLSKHLTL